MDNLSAAQFQSIRRGSQAAVDQTRPILGTIHKVADALGYKLGRETREHVSLDENGNRTGGRIDTSQGFRTTTTGYDRNGITGETRVHRGVPGPLGGRRTTTVVEGQVTQPLPFNGSPQGRSDYGNPFGTP